MKIKPLSPLPKPVAWTIGVVSAVVTFPIWGPLIAMVWLSVKLERLLDPPGWRKVFALWPVECDPWPGHGYAGWVWLEIVWRNPNAPGWTNYRREAPEPPK